ncbi:TVP38/TMEM64 family protein [Microcella sp.]|uniref:TVP38/TMEM64 family protein n=1 Tax=Microcella sp. TaxID=1913979 RepID=UPI00256E2E81|nr:TVP38/TMEM64 family protein [Microcella sp.]MBX9473027.1 TVP38/TMEM64 family protein [Microcella sp.]
MSSAQCDPDYTARHSRRWSASVVRAIALGVFVALAVAVGLIVGVPPLEQVQQTVASWGWAGGAVFVALYAAITLTPAPKNVLSVAAGLIFGFAGALALVYLGALLGAAAAFGLGRSLGRDAVERYTGTRVARLDELLRRRGLAAVIGVRLIPIIPFTAINYGAGLTAVRLRDYALGTAIGIIPGSAAYVALGAFGLEFGWPAWVAIGVLGALTLAGAIWAERGRRIRRDSAAAAPETERDTEN